MKRISRLLLVMCLVGAAHAEGVRLLNATGHDLMFNNKDMQITYTVCEKAFPPKNCTTEQTVSIKGGTLVEVSKPNAPRSDVVLFVRRAIEFDYSRAEVARGEYPLDENPLYGSFAQNEIIIFNDYHTNLIVASKGRA